MLTSKLVEKKKWNEEKRQWGKNVQNKIIMRPKEMYNGLGKHEVKLKY